ncbi:MAG: hypothetical protein IPH09_02705 [bacterium]|nr:hypothetical protein [bacterium]
MSFTHWDAVAKLKVYDYGEDAKGLEIDNAANSPVHRFDGDFTPPPREAGPVFGIDVRPLIERFDHCTFLSLGAGGGGDVLQALVYGAAEVHAVEVVPHINRMLTDGPLAEFTGRIYHDPRVTVATEDGRSYVRRHRGEFDPSTRSAQHLRRAGLRLLRHGRELPVHARGLPRLLARAER